MVRPSNLRVREENFSGWNREYKLQVERMNEEMQVPPSKENVSNEKVLSNKEREKWSTIPTSLLRL